MIRGQAISTTASEKAEPGHSYSTCAVVAPARLLSGKECHLGIVG